MELSVAGAPGEDLPGDVEPYLAEMQERVRCLGGRLDLGSEKTGTRLRAVIPLD